MIASAGKSESHNSGNCVTLKSESIFIGINSGVISHAFPNGSRNSGGSEDVTAHQD